MVLVENLGDELGDEYVVINIGKNVKFIDQIKENIEKKDRIIIKAWGKAIALGVKLALQTIEAFQGLTIGNVSIGTEQAVEIPVIQREIRKKPAVDAGESKSDEGQGRVIRAMSWIEIPIEKP
ncbi:MAG TPA: hypothetical protein VKM55_09090 [Candidatus Lokiarchaeia archaeon]|nr:hypothetical protein [Candidatus Lokiarchaeia archaeon]